MLTLKMGKTVVACGIKDTSRKDSMGLSNGQGSEYGINQCGVDYGPWSVYY